MSNKDKIDRIRDDNLQITSARLAQDMGLGISSEIYADAGLNKTNQSSQSCHIERYSELLTRLMTNALNGLNIQHCRSIKEIGDLIVKLILQERKEEITKINKVINEVLANFKIAMILCQNIELIYGKDRAEMAGTLFSCKISQRDGRVLLLYDAGQNDIIIVKNKSNNKLDFLTNIVHKNKEDNYYGEEDYINMTSINKYQDMKRILNIINQPAYELSDEYAELFRENSTKKYPIRNQYRSVAYGI